MATGSQLIHGHGERSAHLNGPRPDLCAQDGVRRRIEQSRAGTYTCSPLRTSRAEDGATNRRSGNALLETIRFGLRDSSERDGEASEEKRWRVKKEQPGDLQIYFSRTWLIHAALLYTHTHTHDCTHRKGNTPERSSARMRVAGSLSA